MSFESVIDTYHIVNVTKNTRLRTKVTESQKQMLKTTRRSKRCSIQSVLVGRGDKRGTVDALLHHRRLPESPQDLGDRDE